MNNIMNRISQVWGQKSMSQYPELYLKKSYGNNLSYQIAFAFSATIYDAPGKSNSINWKEI
jgi:hypothetical protein